MFGRRQCVQFPQSQQRATERSAIYVFVEQSKAQDAVAPVEYRTKVLDHTKGKVMNSVGPWMPRLSTT